jgi:hypothetical protein
MSNIPRRPVEIVDSISERAADVKVAAAAFTDQIREFERYLSNMRGRVEAHCWGKHPDEISEENSLFLTFHRPTKEWQIGWARITRDEIDMDVKITPLVDAPLTVKVAAVKYFPDLLEAIDKSQEKLVEEVVKAGDWLNAYMHHLPANGGK